MLTLPLESSLTLLVLSEPRPQYKDRANGVMAVDRDTNAPLVTMDLALPMPGGRPQMLQVSIPQPGIPEGLSVGTSVRATGLTYMSGEKNGRRWEIYRASAVTPLKAERHG